MLLNPRFKVLLGVRSTHANFGQSPDRFRMGSCEIHNETYTLSRLVWNKRTKIFTQFSRKHGFNRNAIYLDRTHALCGIKIQQ